MNCREYIEEFLSAHADGELSGAELHEAEAHVASCGGCTARLAEERALKVLVRRHAGAAETPSPVRARLLALLAEEAARGEGAMATGVAANGTRPASHERGVRALRGPALWTATALAACLALVFIAGREMGLWRSDAVHVVYHQGGVPDFDVAIAYLDKFDHRFEPNVPSQSYGDIADAYVEAHMPGFIWHFANSDLKLVGGRLDKLPDERLATFTFYKGDNNSLLCIRYKVPGLRPPPGAIRAMDSHLFYNYYGYSICYSYSPIGDFCCLLVMHRPVKQLLQTIEYASE